MSQPTTYEEAKKMVHAQIMNTFPESRKKGLWGIFYNKKDDPNVFIWTYTYVDETQGLLFLIESPKNTAKMQLKNFVNILENS